MHPTATKLRDPHAVFEVDTEALLCAIDPETVLDVA